MKILILSAATGGGHLRASRAIRDYFVQNDPSSEVEVVDAMKSVGPLVNRTVCDGYHILATKAPKLFGRLYRATNKKTPLFDLMSRFSCQLSRLLYPAVERSAPDAIISTHPFATEMVSHLKSLGAVDVPLITLMTDYGPHLAWIAEHVDAYVVANADMISQMESMGVSREKIYPFGIPVENVFFQKRDKSALRKKFGLDPDLPTILMMAGSFGVANVLDFYRQITAANLPFQIVVITGKNDKLYLAFLDEVKKKRKPTKVVYFTDEVENYMHASDLLVTKPGGMTVSEALACGVPLAVFDAIPGQEEDNANFLLINDMAVHLKPGDDCAETICSLLENTHRLDKMRDNCTEFDKSHSAENIMKLTHRLCEEYAAARTESSAVQVGKK